MVQKLKDSQSQTFMTKPLIAPAQWYCRYSVVHVHFVTFYPLWILDFFFNFLVLLLNNGKIFILNSADQWIWCHPWRKTTIMVWVLSSRVDSALCAIDLHPVFFCHAYTISHRRKPIKDPDQILDKFTSSLWNFGEPKCRCLSLQPRVISVDIFPCYIVSVFTDQ